MKPFNCLALLVVCSVLSCGCSKSNKGQTAPASGGQSNSAATSSEHAHGAGPNGGVVFDFGSHHAEFTVDHGKKECTVVVLGDDEKTPAAVAASELILNINETKTAEGTVVPPMTITMKPADLADSKATKFVGTDSGLGNVADFAGTVSGEVDGKPSQGEFKE
jgi:hypothetical protein